MKDLLDIRVVSYTFKAKFGVDLLVRLIVDHIKLRLKILLFIIQSDRSSFISDSINFAIYDSLKLSLNENIAAALEVILFIIFIIPFSGFISSNIIFLIYFFFS